VQELVAEARAAELPGRLAATLAAVIEVAATIDRSTEGVPALVARLDAVAARAETIDVQPLLDEVANLSADARALLAQPGLQALPGQLGAASTEASAALAEARRVLAGVDGADLNARIASAITAAEEAAREVEASVAGVPALVARIDALAATARELPVEQLVAELTGLSASANALVSSEGTQALPADLSAALVEVEALLREAREADVVGSVNATLGSARAAAESLPGLVARASGLLDQAAATLAGFDETSAIVQEAQDAVREVAAAAGAVADLARAIERDPNSLIFGD
jgi:paraquat-inducible protein B